MIPFWKNPRTDLSPLGDETVARMGVKTKCDKAEECNKPVNAI